MFKRLGKFLKASLIAGALVTSISAGDFNASKWSSIETNIKADTDKLSKVYQENARLCQIYTSKIDGYKKDMRDDELAKATLENYERLLGKYCDPLIHSQK